jgi:Serpin (serine protease inhibitor)
MEARENLVALVDTYCRRVTPAVLEQHQNSSVSSPLGIWLLLAACVTAATGSELQELEEVLGCSASEAASLLARFLEAPPPALHTALALWVRSSDRTTRLVEWSAGLPPSVERGPIPGQADADAWAADRTSGLIKRFPLEVTEFTRLILASALASKVTWQQPFEIAAAAEHLRSSSPWSGRVQHVLVDRAPLVPLMLAETEAAGVVAVHFAVATEELAVVSVAADPAVERHLVFEAAYEIGRRCRAGALLDARRSLFDVPLGPGHSWEIVEDEIASYIAGDHTESIVSANLVDWSVASELDLQRSERFGVAPALGALLRLIGPHPTGDQYDAVQSAVASYTSKGFEAAAITALGVRLAGAIRMPQEKGLRRTGRLFFDHPYAAVALTGRPDDFTERRAGHTELFGAALHTELFGLPLFSAWVDEPREPETAAD